MNGEQPKKHQGRQIIVFGLALYRGVLAIVLGIVLIFYPAKSQNSLMNLMGFFWLSSGFVLVHRERGSGQRISWVVPSARGLRWRKVSSHFCFRLLIDLELSLALKSPPTKAGMVSETSCTQEWSFSVSRAFCFPLMLRWTEKANKLPQGVSTWLPRARRCTNLLDSGVSCRSSGRLSG